MTHIDKTGVTNVLIGLFVVGSGFSGRYGFPGPTFAFPGTQSPTLLYVLGALIIAHGSYQIFKNRRR